MPLDNIFGWVNDLFKALNIETDLPSSSLIDISTFSQKIKKRKFEKLRITGSNDRKTENLVDKEPLWASSTSLI